MKRKRNGIIGFIVMLLFIAFLTNPTEESYVQFNEKRTGMLAPQEVEIERLNFYVFSTYTPITKLEYGITHLGIFNNFFQISDGQFDYPKWLDFFN